MYQSQFGFLHYFLTLMFFFTTYDINTNWSLLKLRGNKYTHRLLFKIIKKNAQ